jgi:hypothetical protein
MGILFIFYCNTDAADIQYKQINNKRITMAEDFIEVSIVSDSERERSDQIDILKQKIQNDFKVELIKSNPGEMDKGDILKIFVNLSEFLKNLTEGFNNYLSSRNAKALVIKKGKTKMILYDSDNADKIVKEIDNILLRL